MARAYYFKRLIPSVLFLLLAPLYHYLLSLLGALLYRFPSREIVLIGVTGTKGKSTTVELISAIFESSGKRTALASTIRFKIGEHSERNLYKMTMPGRFFLQRFLRRAVSEHCDVAVIEMTSEGVKQFRHKWLSLDALVFTNLSPEHIEAHGSYEKYVDAKFELALALASSKKRPRKMIANIDDQEGPRFLSVPVEERLPYSLKDLELYTLGRDGANVVIEGKTIRTPLIGLFNVYNLLAAITTARAFGISLGTIEKALGNLPQVAGRVEEIHSPRGAHKKVSVIVDYAHTTDSLEKLYAAFPNEVKVCVLGNTGGGRDKWKRPEMASIAETHCKEIILTNEDPYDEDPKKIVAEMLRGIKDKSKVRIIMDRREAIRTALQIAPEGAIVVLSGKGTDPYIMGPRGTKTVWSDADVVKEEMKKMFERPSAVK